MGEVVDEEVLTQTIGSRVEGAASVDAGEIVDEAAQHRAIIEHESVDCNPLAGNALGFLQSFLGGPLADAAKTERPFTIKPPLAAISGGLPVRYNDHLLIGTRPSLQHLGSQVQAVLEVGKRIAHVPGRLWQILWL